MTEQEFYEAELARLERMGKYIQRRGYQVPGKPVEPPELNRDGSLKNAKPQGKTAVQESQVLL